VEKTKPVRGVEEGLYVIVFWLKWHPPKIFFNQRVPKNQPEKGFTVAQFGPPSLPVPGTFVSKTRAEPSSKSLIVSGEISLKGIFNRRLHTESN